MKRTPAKQEQTDRFNTLYATGRSPLMQAICNDVCGCGHFGTSWTTRAEANEVKDRLRLGPHSRLLELGAGAGWPGLYLAKQSGCSVVLVDLPETGLAFARQRAREDCIEERVETLVADAADLPFAPNSFDAISHSDLLCCLEPKSEVLKSCRAQIRPNGRMAFTVISVAPGLSVSQRVRAIENGPDNIESQQDYGTMLTQTGWQVLTRKDITDSFQDTCQRQLEADENNLDALRDLLGEQEAEERRANWRGKLDAIRDRVMLRELFVVAPAKEISS